MRNVIKGIFVVLFFSTIFINQASAEVIPDIFDSGSYKAIILTRHVKTEKGKMYFQILKYYKGSDKILEKKAGYIKKQIIVSEKKWSWVKTIKPKSKCIMYYGTNPSVDIIVEIQGKKFRTADHVFFKGELAQFEKNLADPNYKSEDNNKIIVF